MGEIIPDHIQRFVLEKIDSITHLEGVLLLRAADKGWSADMIAERLYISPAEADEVAKQLTMQGFIESEGTPPSYRYAPQSVELDDLLSSLAGLYAAYLVPVTRLIHSKPKNRIQEFANAFRVRKDRHDS